MTTSTARRRNARYTPIDAPGPLPAEMVAAVPSIRRHPPRYLERVVARYGDLVAFPMPKGAVVLVNDPAGVRRVLADNARNYTKRTVQYAALSAVTGQGLLTADGEVWRAHRRVVRPAFHHEVVAGLAGDAVAAGERLRSRWDGAGGPIDVDAEVMRVMLALVGRTLFSADLDADGARLVGAVDAALRHLVHRARSVVPGSWPTPSRRRLAQAVRVLDRACADLTSARRRMPEHRRPADVLSLLLSAVEAGDLTEAGMRDEIITFVIAGYETVASALVWTLSLLADHPDVADRLAAELDGLPPRRDHDPLAHLPFTRAVLDESLRLYPPAWVITRRATDEDEIAGAAVPAGTLVILSPWLLHRRADDWPDPERFDPTRFLGEDGRFGRRGVYTPFGLGPRLCIGRDLALTEAVLVLATLLRGRRVRRPPGTPAPRVDALVTLRPHGGCPLLLSRA